MLAIIVRWCDVSINVKLEASKGVALENCFGALFVESFE